MHFVFLWHGGQCYTYAIGRVLQVLQVLHPTVNWHDETDALCDSIEKVEWGWNCIWSQINDGCLFRHNFLTSSHKAHSILHTHLKLKWILSINQGPETLGRTEVRKRARERKNTKLTLWVTKPGSPNSWKQGGGLVKEAQENNWGSSSMRHSFIHSFISWSWPGLTWRE